VPGALALELVLNSYDYANQNPLSTTDPTGKFSVEGVAIGVGGIAAAVYIYSVYGCIKHLCDNDKLCPYQRDSGDPVTERNRNAWVWSCKKKCMTTFGELGKGGPW
jgi:hypothetical protein